MLDDTHDPTLQSWVESANQAGTDFPLQNLPFGRFRRLHSSDLEWHVGVAIGDQVLDLSQAQAQCPWPKEAAALLQVLAEGSLETLMAAGPQMRRDVRTALSRALRRGSDQAPFLELCLLAQAEIEMALPCRITDYTDFYTGIHHAMAVGKLFRPDAPLLPNYKWVPIGYHGRASSVCVSGQGFVRPHGQLKDQSEVPVYAPTQRLDYELELAALVGPNTVQGMPVPMAYAEETLFGVVLLNDWSARDVQAWEYQPLGPFLSKNFATTISPWVVTMEALAPFRSPSVRPEGDPQPLPHLDSASNRAQGALDITLEVWLQTVAMRAQDIAPVRLMQSNYRDAYWTLAQLVTHHTSGGCNLKTGDLLGSGTQSGPLEGQGGSLLELTKGGAQPITLPGGETRTFLADGDTVILKAYCERDGCARIGFGECRGTVLGATALS